MLCSSPYSVFELFYKATKFAWLKWGYSKKKKNVIACVWVISFLLLGYFLSVYVPAHSCSPASIRNLANANQCYDSLTFHLAAHLVQWSCCSACFTWHGFFAVWCLGPIPPTRVLSRSQLLFPSLACLACGSTWQYFFISVVPFVFNCAYFSCLIRGKKLVGCLAVFF